MSKNLLERLKEKHGEQYEIEEITRFYEYNLTSYPTEDDNLIFKLTVKLDDDNIITTWHTNADTILNRLLDY